MGAVDGAPYQADPVQPGTGIYAHNPKQAGQAFYAVTLAIDGRENASIGKSKNGLSGPVVASG